MKLTIFKRFAVVTMMLMLAGLAFVFNSLHATEMVDNDGVYFSDFATAEQTEVAALSLNERIGQEGMILLKNDGTLPLEGVERITVLGRNSTNIAYGGGGSGGGSAAGAVDLFFSLEAAGYLVNPRPIEFYNEVGEARSVPGLRGGDAFVAEISTDDYPRSVIDSFEIYNDAALVVITRSGSEGGDSSMLNLQDDQDPTKHYLEPTDQELEVLELAKAHFDKVIVLINNSAPMELGAFEDDDAVNGIVWIGHPGESAMIALGQILSGEVNPSGRTVDIYQRDMKQDPTWQNFSWMAQHGLQTLPVTGEAIPGPGFSSWSGTLPNAPITPGTVTLHLELTRNGAVDVTDDGLGEFNPVAGAVAEGTIDYATGQWEIVLFTVEDATAEHTLVRNPAVIDPNATFTGSEWDVYAQNDTAYVGSHTVTDATEITELFISEYAEGSSNNKWIEIYNGTGADVDLSAYSVALYPNGAEEASFTLTLSGTLADGDVYVIRNASAALQDVLDEADLVDGAYPNGVTFYNGDDALALLKNAVVIDVIGEIGEDPESGKWPAGDETEAADAEHTADFTATFQNAALEVYDSNGDELPLWSRYDGTKGDVVMYEEGIYYGYRYYETRAQVEAPGWYEDNVVYPFGYGLSYTSFDWTVTSVDPTGLVAGSSIIVTVLVENTGDVSGKDVVEVYLNAPYINGEVEKAEVTLVGFAKTRLLKPGQQQEVSVELVLQDLASYDYNDANGNGHIGYELDAGTYNLHVSRNSHDVVDTVSFTLAADINYDVDRYTGNPVGNVFEGDYESLPASGDFVFNGSAEDMTIMSRSDFAGTFPEYLPFGTQLVNQTAIDYMTHVRVLADIDPSDPWYVAAAPAGVFQEDEATDNATRTLTMLDEMAGVPLDSPLWTDFMNQLKYSEIIDLIRAGGYSTAALDVIGKDRARDSDGPAGIGGIYWASEVTIAATWNLDLAYQMGRMVGNEALWVGVQGWYGPAMNIHRSAFGGRNFEYYSEDPFVSGMFAANVVRGAQDKGLYTYIKHFFLNEQETERQALMTFADEQTIREIYMVPFRIAIQEGGSKAMMSSFNRIGYTDSSQNYATLTTVLREEWGFEGAVVTDYYYGRSAANYYMNLQGMWLAGNNIPLNSGNMALVEGEWDDTLGNLVWFAPDDPLTTEVDESTVPIEATSMWLAQRQMALEILYVNANSNSVTNTMDVSDLDIEVDVYQMKENSVNIVPLEQATTALAMLQNGEELPAGLSLNGSLLTGNPSAEVGTYTFDVDVAIDDWIEAEATVTVNVLPAFEWTVDLGTAVIDEAFTSTASTVVFVANPNFGDGVSADQYDGYGGPFTYSERNSSLPEGLEISPEGVISGTPTEGGTFDVTLRISYQYFSFQWWTGAYSERTGSADFHVTLVVYYEPDVATLEIGFADGDDATSVTGDLVLPAEFEEGTVTWSSNNTAVIGNDGVLVARPAEDTDVTLTATVVKGAYTDTKDFVVTVPKAFVTLSADEIQALVDGIDRLSEAEVLALIDALEFYTPAEVNALIAALDFLTPDEIDALLAELDFLTPAEVQALIDNIDLLTEDEVQTMIDNAGILTEAQIQALIEAEVMTDAQVQALIDSSVLTEAQIQTLIDNSIAAIPEPETGCAASASIPSIGIFAILAILGSAYFVIRKRF